jgi:excisionase family DNA binding protein
MRLLRVEEAAHMLGLRPSTIRKLIYQRQLHVVRPTKRAVRLREDDILAIWQVGHVPNLDPGVPRRTDGVAPLIASQAKRGTRK